jgi:hypothetical protein
MPDNEIVNVDIANIKRQIIATIAREVEIGGLAGLDQYYKNPGYDKGGLYGKGDFGKSDPAHSKSEDPFSHFEDRFNQLIRVVQQLSERMARLEAQGTRQQ